LNWPLTISTHYNNQILIRFKYYDSNLELGELAPVEVGFIKRTESVSNTYFKLKPRSMGIAFASAKK